MHTVRQSRAQVSLDVLLYEPFRRSLVYDTTVTLRCRYNYDIYQCTSQFGVRPGLVYVSTSTVRCSCKYDIDQYMAHLSADFQVRVRCQFVTQLGVYDLDLYTAQGS